MLCLYRYSTVQPQIIYKSVPFLCFILSFILHPLHPKSPLLANIGFALEPLKMLFSLRIIALVAGLANAAVIARQDSIGSVSPRAFVHFFVCTDVEFGGVCQNLGTNTDFCSKYLYRLLNPLCRLSSFQYWHWYAENRQPGRPFLPNHFICWPRSGSQMHSLCVGPVFCRPFLLPILRVACGSACWRPFSIFRGSGCTGASQDLTSPGSNDLRVGGFNDRAESYFCS